MANLEKMTLQYVEEGYTELLAEARVCQDIVLKAISESTMNRNVTIKGGVVMRSITGDVRLCHDDEGVSLLMNSKEQIFAEKLRALIKFGTFSGRVKDIFDLCYLSEYVDNERLLQCIHTYILDDSEMFENNMEDIKRRVKKVFADKGFYKSVENSGKDNWLRIKASVAFERILDCLNRISHTN